MAVENRVLPYQPDPGQLWGALLPPKTLSEDAAERTPGSTEGMAPIDHLVAGLGSPWPRVYPGL